MAALSSLSTPIYVCRNITLSSVFLLITLLATPLFAQLESDDPFKGTQAQTEKQEILIFVSEVIVKGIDGHPEQKRLELEVYDAMTIRPGSRVTQSELQRDLKAIYASGWFSEVVIEPVGNPFGVKLIVRTRPNPVLTTVMLKAQNNILPKKVLERIFGSSYGRILNLNELQIRTKRLQRWYFEQGYSLARISSPSRISPNGVVELRILIGTVASVSIQFLNQDGETTDDEGRPIRGNTKLWVIRREISTASGKPFNRNQLEDDIKRLYGTGLFSDVKVTLKPMPAEPGKVRVLLGIVEQRSGSLSGGLGYTQSQGIFGQAQLQNNNLFGRAWNLALNLSYGQYGGLANFILADPWVRGDFYRTSLRTSLFFSREVPQVFRSQDNSSVNTVSDHYKARSDHVYEIDSSRNLVDRKLNDITSAATQFPNLSWFDYEGGSVALQRVGGGIILSRPLNGGNPLKIVPWNILFGLNLQNVRPTNFAGRPRPYGVKYGDINKGKALKDKVICIAFNCANENNLASVRLAATYNKLNNPRNPTAGNFFSFGTEQYISIGTHSPSFNRLRANYAHFIPVNWLDLSKACRSKPSQQINCSQTVGIQIKAGAMLGQLPPYEAFCLGGSSSVRGWYSCNLAVGRSFGETTIEYRFPIISIFSGELFIDAGTSFGSQADVPGSPGELLNKPGDGFSIGLGVIITTPVGPLRLEAASQNFIDKWRFNLGVGWKF